jgi:hypothetical protein
VIRVLNLSRVKDADLPPNALYVGREFRPRRPAGSVWANPFPVSRYGMEAGPMFSRWLLTGEPRVAWPVTPAELRRRAPLELAGKVLCCWCLDATWKVGRSHRCHAEVWAAFAEGALSTVNASTELAWWTAAPVGLMVEQRDLFGGPTR